MSSYHPDRDSCARARNAHSANRSRHLAVLLATIAAVSLFFHPDRARSTGVTADSHGSASLNTVTIQAAKARKELERRVDHYVVSNVVTYLHDSLVRWNTPVCPLAAGLQKDMGEFILGRISQVARAAHVPLAGEHCAANLYVIATPYPDQLLQKWRERNPRMYSLCNGWGGVQTFLHSRRPVRVWYNTKFTAPDGHAVPLDTLQVPYFSPFQGCVGGGGLGTRIRYSAVQSLSSVFVIVDLSQTKNMTIGQLADYVSLLGLAQIDVEGDPGQAPTILNLFRASQQPPQALSSWDQALLYSLYNTNQSSVLEVSMIERSIVSQVTSGE